MKKTGMNGQLIKEHHFMDVNKNGKYEPEIDIPGVPGASQTIWINYNDSIS